jgi:pilus assembly protein Flp/PilA
MIELENERGQGFLEYALIITLVAIIVLAILTLLGPQVGKMFSQVIHQV